MHLNAHSLQKGLDHLNLMLGSLILCDREGFYLHDDLHYKLLNECKLSDPEVIEFLFMEITVPHGKNIVGCVYRPLNQNTALFLDKLNDVLSYITKNNKQCYIMGDFNLDLLQYNHHTPTQEFIDTLFSFAFIPLISNPTCLTSYSAMLIDNIFTTTYPMTCRSKNDLRTTWKLLNEVINKRRRRAPFPSSFESNYRPISLLSSFLKK
ncbi:hypothetical protein P5673_030635 [Acropora cervicornis]|uniref:Endonuclease/exonuclease/phosphatase domain-containing protein n=1 Tax=Acropora cervicornis TaxID=6130 RepID=A0AAD9PTY0_ACRCE|nr:hypothetical protein P5673_030635 [Acropora cervicornis]